MHRHDEAIGILVGQRPQEHRVHDGEDGSRRTNAEAEGEDAEKREGGFLDQNAEAVAKVAKECVHADSTVNADSRLARIGLPGRKRGAHVPSRWRPRRARMVVFKSASEVEAVRSMSASPTASSNARTSWALLIAAPLCARMSCRHPIEKLNLTVEEDDGHLRPRFVVNGRPTGLAPRLDRLAGGRGRIRFHWCPPTRHAKTPSFPLSFRGRTARRGQTWV